MENRINTIHMIGFFMGGALGTTLGAYACEAFRWSGVFALGIALSVAIVVAHLVFQKTAARSDSEK